MPPLKIFVVDDDQDDLEILRIIISELCPRCNINLFNSALDLLVNLLSQEKPDVDLIIMDATMPRINGLMCLKSLKEHPDLKRIPTYIVAGSIEPNIINAFLMLGAASVDEKPEDYFSTKKLISKILQDALRRAGDKPEY